MALPNPSKEPDQILDNEDSYELESEVSTADTTSTDSKMSVAFVVNRIQEDGSYISEQVFPDDVNVTVYEL